MPPLILKEININLPWIGNIKLEVSDADRIAAWQLYVQLATRIISRPLEKDEGLVREALGSIHAVFDITRKILIDAGPDVAKSKRSFGPLAIRVINERLAPFLAKWHLAFSEYENGQRRAFLDKHTIIDAATVPIDQTQWSEINTFYDELGKLRQEMAEYVQALADIAGVETSDESGSGLRN